MKRLLAILLVVTAVQATLWTHRSKPEHHFKLPFLSNIFSNRPQSSNLDGVDMSKVEWVCRNPNTNDMMLITSQDIQNQNQGNGQYGPHYPFGNGGGPYQQNNRPAQGQGGWPNQYNGQGQSGWPNQQNYGHGQGGWPNQQNSGQGGGWPNQQNSGQGSGWPNQQNSGQGGGWPNQQNSGQGGGRPNQQNSGQGEGGWPNQQNTGQGESGWPNQQSNRPAQGQGGSPNQHNSLPGNGGQNQETNVSPLPFPTSIPGSNSEGDIFDLDSIAEKGGVGKIDIRMGPTENKSK